MLPARIPVLLAGLLAAQQADADVHALLACRQLPAGQARVDFLERESAVLEREQAAAIPAVSPASPAPVSATAAIVAPPSAASQTPVVAVPAARAITTVDYVDGRPLFTLVGGERWLAREERRLTLHQGGDTATFERTPAGMVLHFNGSFYGLHVSRVP